MPLTEGPWNVQHGDRDSRVFKKTLLAIVYSEAFGDRETQEANARLIAAAPELLIACKALQMEAAARGCGLRIADEAIAKAEEKA